MLLFSDKSEEYNAMAIPYPTGEKLISVNKGLITAFNDKFTDLDSYIESLLETALLRQIGFDAPAYFLMFQVCSMFVYYHELGHIIQFVGAEKKVVEERRAKVFAKRLNILDHAKEFDSDEFAINLVFLQIKHYWEKKLPENKSPEALEGLITINVVALYILFDLLSGGISLPLYYEI